MNTKANILLENGLFLKGKSLGYRGITGGELCFNTSMTGYQEILTDPSYSGQIINMTYPHMGNYGVNSEFWTYFLARKLSFKKTKVIIFST